MKIQVTQSHIDRGLQGNSYNCPVALACKDAGLAKPSVSNWGLSIDGLRSILLPKGVNWRIAHFDKMGKMNPFLFEIEVQESIN